MDRMSVRSEIGRTTNRLRFGSTDVSRHDRNRRAERSTLKHRPSAGVSRCGPRRPIATAMASRRIRRLIDRSSWTCASSHLGAREFEADAAAVPRTARTHVADVSRDRSRHDVRLRTGGPRYGRGGEEARGSEPFSVAVSCRRSASPADLQGNGTDDRMPSSARRPARQASIGSLALRFMNAKARTARQPLKTSSPDAGRGSPRRTMPSKWRRARRRPR